MSDPFYAHTAAVGAVAAHGIASPTAWSELLDRFHRFNSLTAPCVVALAEEVVRPTGVNLELLRAAALAEQTAGSVDQAAVVSTVAAAVHGELVRLYEPAAARNYKIVADRFDTAASLFTKAARICDPDVGSGDVIRLGEQARAAWLNSEVLSGELDALLPVLCAAACLAGADDSIVGLGAEGDPLRIPLVCDPGKAHRRKLWTAWAAVDGRCGRWAALSRLGVKLRADARPDRLQPYEECRPYSVKWVPGPHGGHEQEFTDPHDNEATGVIGRMKEQVVDAVWGE